MAKVELKDRMEYSDMVALHKEYYPWLETNKVNVGTLARREGYVLRHQTVGGRSIAFYIKKELINK